MNDPGATLGVALVGYDGAGTQNHQLDMYEPAFLTHPRFSIRAVTDAADVSDERRRLSQAAAQRLDVPYVEDPAEALARSDVAVASICVGFGRRVEVVELAAQHGVHVLVDKPMALRLEEIDEIERTVSREQIICVPAHHHRFLTSVRRTRTALQEGTIGELLGVHADFIVTTGATRQAADQPEVWPLGEVMNFAVYPIDVVRYLTGSEVVTVHGACGGFFFGGDEDEDLGVLSLTLEHDVIATMSIARTPLTGHPSGGQHRYRIIGSDGVLLLDTKEPSMRLADADGNRWSPFPTLPNSVSGLLDGFAEAVDTGGPTDLGPGDARAALATTLAARRSSAEHRVIDVTPST